MKKTILLKKLISIVLAGAAAIDVCAYNPFDSGAGKKAKAAISSAISKAYSSITDRYSSNGSVPLEQMNSYVNDLYGKTDELLESGDITYREKQNSYVYVKDKNGSGVFLCAPNDELSAGGSVSYVSYQPFYSDFSSKNVYTELVDETGSAYQSLGSAADVQSPVKDSSVTFEKAKQFGDNSIILWDGHGIFCSDLGSCLMLSVRYEDKYSDDYKEDRICLGVVNDVSYIVLTPKFFDYYYGKDSLKNDVIYLGACDSARDRLVQGFDPRKSLSGVLESKGAKAVFANSEEIYTYYCHKMEHSVLKNMAEGQTASNALSKAKKENGYNDHTPQFNSQKPDAEVLVFGDGDYSLPKSGGNTYTNSSYGWSVTVPDGWNDYGTILEYQDMSGSEMYGSVGFYHKSLQEKYNMGHVFTIFAVPVGSKNDDRINGGTAKGGYLGKNSRLAFYYWEATDVQASPESPTYRTDMEELRTLRSFKDEIVNSFRLS